MYTHVLVYLFKANCHFLAHCHRTNNNMAKRAQKWKDEIVLVFYEVLADPENGFANPLEMLTLKKSANTEVFAEIKYEFDKKLSENEIENVDTEISKLRRKYTLVKGTWRALHDRVKKGTGKGAKGYPK